MSSILYQASDRCVEFAEKQFDFVLFYNGDFYDKERLKPVLF